MIILGIALICVLAVTACAFRLSKDGVDVGVCFRVRVKVGRKAVKNGIVH